MSKNANNKVVLSIFFSLLCLFILIRCGSEKGSFLSGSLSDGKISKAGRLGSEDINFSIVSSTSNNQTRPKLAFNNISSNYFLVWEDRRNGNADIYGEVVYSKYFPGTSTTYNFSRPIREVIAYDQYESKISTSSYTILGIGSNSVTISGLPTNTYLVFISKDFAIATGSAEQKNPTISFGCDGSTCRFMVLWEDYTNGIDKPFINGRLFDGLFNSTPFTPTGSTFPYYSYTQSSYNLNNTSVGSLAQIEPDVTFDEFNKNFIVTWVDRNSLERRYKFSPRKSLISDLANTGATTSFSLYSSFSPLTDQRVAVYRKFDVTGIAVDKVELNSDVVHNDKFLSSDVYIDNANNIIILGQRASIFRNEKTPKVSVNDNGEILSAYVAQKVNFKVKLSYTSDGASAIVSGPNFTSLSSLSYGQSNQLFIRYLNPLYTPKDYERKLYQNPYLIDAALDANVLDYGLVRLSGDRILVLYTVGDKLRKVIVDLSTGLYTTPEDLVSDTTKVINSLSVSKAAGGHYLVAYEEFDSTTNISQIKGLFLKSNGDKDGSPFTLTNNSTSNKRYPSVARGDAFTNRFLTVYEDSRNGSFFSSNMDIYGNFYSRQIVLKPQIYLPITSLDFGTVYSNTTTIKQYSIQNTGDADLVISSIVSTSLPTFDPVETSTTISPSSSKNLNVRFIPSSAGSFNAFLNISSNSFQSPKKTIKLSGKSVFPTMIEEVSPLISFAIENQPLPETNRYAAKFNYGIPPYSWQISGAPFLSFTKISSVSSTNRDRILIRGTPVGINPPNVGQSIPINITISDKNSRSFTYDKELRVYPALSINDSSLPLGIQGNNYNHTLNVSGGRGSGNYAFSNISSSTFPGKLSTLGLSLNSSTGTITGIPKLSGDFTFTISLCDKDVSSYCTSKNLSLSVSKTLNITTNLTQIYAGKSINFVATGGSAPYKWSSSNLNTSVFKLYSSGLFKAYSSASKGFYNFRVRATDSIGAYDEKDFNVEVKKIGINSVSNNLLNAMVGKQYTLALTANDTIGAYTWGLKSGTLPPGLIIETNTGIIAGTPSVSNISGFSFVVEVTDSDNNKAEIPLTIKVYPELKINSSHLKTEWTEGLSYNEFVSIDVGSRVMGNSYIFNLSGPAIGLNIYKFGNYSGNLKATSLPVGEYAYTVTTFDNLGFQAAKAFNLKINPSPQITSSGNIILFQNYSSNNHFTFSAAGGTGALSFSMTPINYNGIKIDSSGRLYGKSSTLDTSGTSVTITVTDSLGASAQKNFTFYTYDSLNITTDPAIFPTKAMKGKSYSVKFIASGGPPTSENYVYSMTNIPGGLTFSTFLGQGILQGSPFQEGDNTFTINVSKGSASRSQSYTFTVYPEIKINDLNLPIAVKGKNYSHTLDIIGGSNVFNNYSAQYTFIGSSPGGITFNNLTISGTPLNTGSYSLKVRVYDKTVGSQYYDEKTFSINIYNQPTFSNLSSFGTVYEGQNISFQAEAINGVSPYVYTKIGGILPAGLSFSNIGLISGKLGINTFGNYSVIVVAKDSLNIESEPKKYRFYVDKINISGTVTNNTMVGKPYLAILTVNGGTAPYNTVILGNPIAPPGLSATTTGNNIILTGTPTTEGSYGFKVKVTDFRGAETENSYSITVHPELKITNTSLPPAVVGTSYNTPILAEGGSGVFSKYSTISGNLPAGLSLNKTTGSISGTATVKGTYSFTIRVFDSNNLTADKLLSINVYEKILIQASSLPSNWYQNDTINYNLTYTGGSGSVQWTLTSGALPEGLTLNSAGLISGKIDTSGTFTFTIRITDLVNGDYDEKTYTTILKTIPISESKPGPYSAIIGKSFSLNILTTDTNSPHIFEISNGNVPGLNIITFEGKGLISGVPLQKGDYTLRVRVTDRDGHYSEKDYHFTIYEELKINNSNLKNGIQGTTYNDQINITGGVVTGFSNYSSSAIGLPEGLMINKSGGINGIPRVGGSYNVKIKVVDGKGFEVERDLLINIEEKLKITTEITELYIGDIIALTGDGGVTPYTFSIETLSVPFSITGGNLKVENTAEEGKSYGIRIKITDSSGSYSYRDYTIKIGKLTIREAEGSRLYGIEGSSYVLQLITEGGIGSYSYSIKTGVLPGGLILNRTEGKIQGIPTTSGSYNITIQSEDIKGHKGEKSYTIHIYPALNINTTTITTQWTKGVAYPATTITASGGFGGVYLYSMNSTNGLNIDSTGQITGTPITAGNFTYTIQVEDELGFKTTKEVLLTINEEPKITQTEDTIYLEKGGEYGLSHSGGTAPFTWSVIGALPTGVTLSGNKLEATPSASGTSTVTLRVTDTTGAYSEKEVKVEVLDNLTITTDPVDITKGIVGQKYLAELIISGGKTPYKVTQKSLIGGLILSQLEGRWYLSGVPSQSGDQSVEIEIEDNRGVKTLYKKTITIYEELTIEVDQPKDGGKDSPYSETLTLKTKGGKAPYSYTVTGLPIGITYNITGTQLTLSGTPAGSGSHIIKIEVTDANNFKSNTEITLTIHEELILTLSKDIASVLYTNDTIETDAITRGGSGNYSYSIIGTWPMGLTIEEKTGKITGKITGVVGTAYTFDIKVTDTKTGITKTKAVTTEIKEIVQTATTVFPYEGIVGRSINIEITGTNGSSPYLYQIVQGSISGITITTLNNKGLISGVPLQKGDYTLRVRVTDRDGHYSEKDYHFTIYEELKINNSNLKNGIQGTTYNDQINITGGVVTGFSNYSSSAIGLPEGLMINKSGGINGIPRVGGSYNVKIKVVDGKGFEVERDLLINIEEKLKITTEITELYIGDIIALTGDGGVTPYTFSIETLSVPFSITGGNLKVENTAEEGKSYGIRIKITDSSGSYSYRDYTIKIGKLTISEAVGTKFYGMIGEQYSLALNASGGIGNISWTINSGSLPPGLLLNSATGMVFGVPSASGSYTFTVKAEDAAGHIKIKSYNLVIYEQLIIVNTTLSNWTVNTPYSVSISATGGTGSYYYSMNSTNGLSINSSTGLISGTPILAGTFVYTVTVTDSLGFTTNKNFTIVINELPKISSPDVVYLFAGLTPTFSLSVNNGTAPFNWSVLAGSISGITINNDGTLSGTPLSGDYTVTVKVTDNAAQSDTKGIIFKVINPLNITTEPSSTSFNGIVNIPFKIFLDGSGGVSPYNWSINANIPGLSLTSMAGRGMLSGVPTSVGDYPVKISLIDSKGNKKETEFLITIYPELKITNNNLKNGVLGDSYLDQFLITGGSGNYSYAITSGTLHTGVSLNPSTGIISGTPTESGTKAFRLALTDVTANLTIEKDFTLSVYQRPIITTNPNLGTLYNGQVINIPLQSSLGSTTTYTYSLVSGTLPAGLTLDSGGAIAGKINSTTGTFTFNLKVKDGNNIESTPVSFTVNIGNITLNTSNYKNISMVNRDYSSSLIISGGDQPFDIKLIPNTTSVPPGISTEISGNFINIKGKPTQGGIYNFNLVITDSKNAQVIQNLQLNVLDELVFDKQTLISAIAGQAYTEQITVSGGDQSNLTFVKKSGILPQGITLNSDGTISGTTNAIGNFLFVVRVTDAQGFIAEKEYTLSVSDKVKLSVEKDSYYFQPNRAITSIQINATGGSTPYLFNVTGLPSGINYQITDKGLTLTGTPTTKGNYTVSVTVTDNGGSTSTKTFTITIDDLTIDSSGLVLETDVNDDYFGWLKVEGGADDAVYEWTLENGLLPDGLSLGVNTGLITGKATKEGIFRFTVKVTDKNTGVYGTTTLQIKVVGDVIYAKESGSWKCFIATATYGSYLDPHVKVLRDFRDKFLLTNRLGKEFVKFYYRHSPKVAKIIAENDILRYVVRTLLTPIVYMIKFCELTLLGFLLVLIPISRKLKKGCRL